MKTALKLTIFLLTTLTFSQDFFFKHTLDWNNAINGAGHSYGDTPSYNPEFMLGFDFETWRVGTGYEDHDTIDYSKWFLEGDKRLTTGRFDFYAGVEVGWIWRKHFYELQNFKGVVVDDLKASMTAGMNFEMQFKIIEGVHFTSNINVFTTEGNSTRWQFLRWDWMSGVVIKIPYTL